MQRQGDDAFGKSSGVRPRVRFTVPDAVAGQRVVGTRKKIERDVTIFFSNVTQLGRKAAEYAWDNTDTVMGMAETHLGKHASQQFARRADREGRRAFLSEPNQVEAGKKDVPKGGVAALAAKHLDVHDVSHMHDCPTGIGNPDFVIIKIRMRCICLAVGFVYLRPRESMSEGRQTIPVQGGGCARGGGCAVGRHGRF